MGQCFQVRQLHAHAWVECRLGPEQLPRDLIHAENYWDWSEYGGWLQLEPTPESEANSQTTWYNPITKSMQWFDSVWSYYVVELNYERQRKAIFQPIVDAFTFLYQWLSDSHNWRSLFKRISGCIAPKRLARPDCLDAVHRDNCGQRRLNGRAGLAFVAIDRQVMAKNISRPTAETSRRPANRGGILSPFGIASRCPRPGPCRRSNATRIRPCGGLQFSCRFR